MNVLALGLSPFGIASVVVGVLARQLFAAVAAVAFLVTSSWWIARDEDDDSPVAFSCIVSGAAVLCAAVLASAGPRKWASLKMLAGVLTQTSVATYRVLPWTLPYAPTDAMLASVFLLVPSIGAVACRRAAPAPARLVLVAHGALTAATLALRFHRTVDAATGVDALGRATYVAFTHVGLALGLDARPRHA